MCVLQLSRGRVQQLQVEMEELKKQLLEEERKNQESHEKDSNQSRSELEKVSLYTGTWLIESYCNSNFRSVL